MNIVIFDDEQSTLDYLQSLIIEHYGDRHSVFTYSDNQDLQNFAGEPDVLLADIKLQESNGIEQAILFLQKHPKVKVIFITGYPSEYFEDIFSGIRPYAFLGKPIHEERLFAHLDNADHMESVIYRFTYKGKSHAVPLSSILYIESHGRQKIIHTTEQTYALNISFEAMSDSLSPDFVRCHSAFVVNIRQIISRSSGNLLMKDNALIPLGRKYKDTFIRQFNLLKMEEM